MKLRELRQSDANRMLEWMHDPFVVEKLQTDFSKKKIEDCWDFIDKCNDEKNLHLAIADEEDLYLGTVSLKHITDNSAEFAITICKDAMGKGYAIYAMKEMLKIGFEKYKVRNIYWCVAKDNSRALKFYDKNSFERVQSNEIEIVDGYTHEQIDSYIWYQVKAKD